MKIAIIGSGNVGTSLATAAVKAGHDVTLTSSDGTQAAQAAAATGANAATSNAEAASGADIVILAIPASAAAAVADEIAPQLGSAVLVDTTNPVNATFDDLTTSGRSAAEDLQDRLSGIPVVKAFNTVFAGRHANPSEGDLALDAFIAGDDDDANARVAGLAESLGYRPVVIGRLRFARALEEMAFLNISLNATNGWVWQSAWTLVGPTNAA